MGYVILNLVDSAHAVVSILILARCILPTYRYQPYNSYIFNKFYCKIVENISFLYILYMIIVYLYNLILILKAFIF